MNLYGFAGGDPVTFSDPFGLESTANNRKRVAITSKIVALPSRFVVVMTQDVAITSATIAVVRRSSRSLKHWTP
jgi:hypothetical protein